jgi:hypothetical protein
VRTVFARFSPWTGQPLDDDYGGKPVLNLADAPLFAELVVLKHFREAGWDGVWVDAFRRRLRVGWPDEAPAMPPQPRKVFEAIFDANGGLSGFFDLFLWRGTEYLLVELKRRGHDAIRDSQRRFIDIALRQGLPAEAFLIVEWEVTGPWSATPRTSLRVPSDPSRSPAKRMTGATRTRPAIADGCPGSGTPVARLAPEWRPGVAATSTKAECPVCHRMINLLKDGSALRGHRR